MCADRCYRWRRQLWFCGLASTWSFPPVRASLPLREISQVGRLLSFLRRHQIAVRAQVIDLPADIDVVVVLVAIVLSELSLNAAIILHHRPRPRERVVDGGDLVVDEIGIGLVEGQPLL